MPKKVMNRQLTFQIACAIQPLQNIRVTRKVNELHGKDAYKAVRTFFTFVCTIFVVRKI